MIEHINRLQAQIIVHSIIYYRHNDSIWSDYQYDSACNELMELINNHPVDFESSKHYDIFKDFTGETGYHLLSEINLGYWDHLATQLLLTHISDDVN